MNWLSGDQNIGGMTWATSASVPMSGLTSGASKLLIHSRIIRSSPMPAKTRCRPSGEIENCPDSDSATPAGMSKRVGGAGAAGLGAVRFARQQTSDADAGDERGPWDPLRDLQLPAGRCHGSRGGLDGEIPVAEIAEAAPLILLEAFAQDAHDTWRRVAGYGGPIGIVLEHRGDRVGRPWTARTWNGR